MVRSDGTLKIIDFGFGKKAANPEDFGKSISVNSWCAAPAEFANSMYDYATEVYFIGKMFEQIIQNNEISDFEYTSILRKMCLFNPELRVQKFGDIEKEINTGRFFELEFESDERSAYKGISDYLASSISKIAMDAKYQTDVDRIEKELDNIYRTVMLEDTVPDSAVVLRCFVQGNYYYRKTGLHVWVVKEFLKLLKASSKEKKRIIISNIHTRLDAIPKYDELDSSESSPEDDLPF